MFRDNVDLESDDVDFGSDGSVRVFDNPDGKGILVDRVSAGTQNCHGSINTHYVGHDPDKYLYGK